MLYPFSRLRRPARSLAICGPALCRKRGFNLIESAIVLGVVGLVIGGIWVASSAMIENHKVNKTVADIQLIVKSTQNLVSISDAILTVAQNGGVSTHIESTLLDASAFPADWIKGSQRYNPFGGNVTVIIPSGSTSVSKPRFEIWLYSIPKAACIKLVAKLSGIAAMAGEVGTGGFNESAFRSTLGEIVVYPSGWWTTTFPTSLATAATACDQSTNTVIPVYGLRVLT